MEKAWEDIYAEDQKNWHNAEVHHSQFVKRSDLAPPRLAEHVAAAALEAAKGQGE